MDIRQQAQSVQNQVIQWRRDLHAHPEESMREFRTSEAIAHTLENVGISADLLDPTGVIAEIHGAHPGKTIALRADIDALSVREKTDLPFKSQALDLMHACGHDSHTAMLLGAAHILKRNSNNFDGCVRLIFQPGEEVSRGAKFMIANGALDDVDFIFGQHIFSQYPAGNLMVSPGPVMSSSSRLKITISGNSTHGAAPHKGNDSTVAAAATVMGLQTISSREVDPFTPVIITIGKITSGTRFNIVSGQAVLEGTIRLFDLELEKKMPSIIKRVVTSTCEALGNTAKVEIFPMHGPLICDEKATELVQKAAEKVVGPHDVTPFPNMLLGEDFAEYTQRVPGVFASLGGGGTYPQHSDHFCIEEEAFVSGVGLYAQTALDFLQSPQ